ncbi:MAG: shikimate kinase [Actinomycetaceae bacterium]|nr:shikimate kinase [Actinomycetaceae bacterium]
MTEHIVLVGLPASGKTRLGKLIASHLSRDFIDLDAAIEAATGKTISQLFERGEEYFRQRETEALREAIGSQNPAVISTGGGIVEREVNRHMLARTHVVFIDVPVEIAIRRAQRSQARPLFAQNLPATMRKLAGRRRDLYLGVASQTVQLDDSEAKDNAQLIIDTINQYNPGELP